MDFNKINEKIKSLKPDILNINKDIKDAVEITKIQKDFSVASLRKIAEKILSSLYEKEYGQPPKETMLQKVKNQLLSRDVLPRRIRNYVDTIQDFGNMSAHHTDENLETEDIEICFMSLISIYKWYIEKYSGTSVNTQIKDEKPIIPPQTDEKIVKTNIVKEEEIKATESRPEMRTKIENENKPKKKNAVKKVFITILIIIMLCGIGYLAYLFVSNFINDNLVDQQNITNNTDNNSTTTDNNNTTTDNNNTTTDNNSTTTDNNSTTTDNSNIIPAKSIVEIRPNQWTEVCKDDINKPSPRRYFAMSYIEYEKAILFGGEDRDNLLNDTWIYDDSKQSWEEVNYEQNDKYPKARKNTAIAQTNNGKVVLFGGKDNDGKNLSDTWIFDIETRKWTEISINDEYSPSARSGHSLTYDGNDKIVLYGGSQGNDSKYYDLRIYDIKNNTWVEEYEIGLPKPVGRAYHTISYSGNSSDGVILFGGKSRDVINFDRWMFNSDSKKWIKIKENNEYSEEEKALAREKHSMQYISKNTLIMFGGTGKNGNLSQGTYLYDVTNNEWGKQSLSLNPPLRFGHSIAYLGNDKVVMFGGCVDNLGKKLLNDTYVFLKKTS